MFIFVITKDDYKGADPKIKISKNEAAAWHSQGVNRLPKKIAGMPFSEDYLVNFLVYEFEVPESNHIPKQRCSCLYLAKEHLELSGLQTELGR